MLAETLSMLQRKPETLERGDIDVLRQMVEFHRHQYYELDTPLITDEEFDRLYALLVATEEKFQESHASSPTQKVQDLVDNHFTKSQPRNQISALHSEPIPNSGGRG